MKTKVCTKCKAEKSLDDFHRNKRKSDGRQPWCKTCKRAWDYEAYHSRTPQLKQQIIDGRKRSLKRNREYIVNHLREHSCIDCGNADLRVLDFDHVRGKKTTTVMLMVMNGYSLETIQREIDKCEVRCANCHRIKTNEELGLWRNSIAPSS